MKSRKWNVIKIVVTILVCILGVSACSNSKSNPEEEKIRQALIGEWEYRFTYKSGKEGFMRFTFEADSYMYEWEDDSPISNTYVIDTDKRQIVLSGDWAEGYNILDYLYNDDSGQLSFTKYMTINGSSDDYTFTKTK